MTDKEHFVCLSCNQLVELNQHGYCERCGANRLIPAAVLQGLVKQLEAPSGAVKEVDVPIESESESESRSVKSNVRVPFQHSECNSGELILWLDYYGHGLDRLTFVCSECDKIVGVLDDTKLKEKEVHDVSRKAI